MDTTNTTQISIVILILTLLCNGNNSCDFEPCLNTYNTLKSLFDTYRNEDINRISPGVINTICSQQNELKDCTKKQSKSCRGDLNYHFFVRLAQRLQTENGRIGQNCSETASITPSIPHHTTSTHNTRHGSRGAKCNPKISNDEQTVGCAIYGLTNLKSFSDSLNFTDVPYCSLSGAWSLLDLDPLAVQITNKGGLSPLPKEISTTTLVTVIVKNNVCAERKTYQATFDEVPGIFNDGSTTAGNVYIEEIKRSEHVRIHFPYALTVVEIIKVIGHLPISTLSVTIKMPLAKASNMSSTLSRTGSQGGLPLCFYGCPKTANIKPRSLPSEHRCPSEQESSSVEFMDTANSITSAICDSLSNVQDILRDTSILEPRVKFSEYVTTQSDSSSGLYSSSFRHSKYNPHAENSALTSRSPPKVTRSVFLCFSILYIILLIYSFR